MDATALGIVLAKRRRRAGLTQAGLARRMGTTQSSIARVESGRVLPTLPLLERFAEATGEPLELVIGGGRPNLPSAAERRRRVRRALKGFEFDPWQREPTEVEARSLVADGLTRERFESTRAPSTGRR